MEYIINGLHELVFICVDFMAIIVFLYYFLMAFVNIAGVVILAFDESLDEMDKKFLAIIIIITSTPFYLWSLAWLGGMEFDTPIRWILQYSY